MKTKNNKLFAYFSHNSSVLVALLGTMAVWAILVLILSFYKPPKKFEEIKITLLSANLTQKKNTASSTAFSQKKNNATSSHSVVSKTDATITEKDGMQQENSFSSTRKSANLSTATTSDSETNAQAAQKNFVEMADGGKRSLQNPEKPVIILSEECTKLLDSSRTVEIRFSILASGVVPLSSISFYPSAILPEAIKKEVTSQIALWRFSVAENDGNAVIKYSIIKR